MGNRSILSCAVLVTACAADRSLLEVTLGRYVTPDAPNSGRAVYMIRGGRTSCAPAGPAPTPSECTATILADAATGSMLLTEESGAPRDVSSTSRRQR